MLPADQKRIHGRFFTVGNPFSLEPFRRWLAKASLSPTDKVLEPFCGANHLVRLVREAGHELEWSCYDLHPPAQELEGVKIQKRDSLGQFPKGFRVAITNPPYLARNSATRRGLPFPSIAHDDVYKHALAVALAHVNYLAAIVPESFLTSGELTSRLDCVVSLPWPMFDDTEHPVCLALFSPQPTPDFEVFSADQCLGWHSELSSFLSRLPHASPTWRFNDPNGSIGIRAIDNQVGPSLAFVPGEEFPTSLIKPSSRTFTRVSGLPHGVAPCQVITKANALLAEYRNHTHDVLLTPFKGLRADGRYRRRLDFATARALLSAALTQVQSVQASPK